MLHMCVYVCVCYMMQLEDKGTQGSATGYTDCPRPVTESICGVPACMCVYASRSEYQQLE